MLPSAGHTAAGVLGLSFQKVLPSTSASGCPLIVPTDLENNYTKANTFWGNHLN